MNDFERRVRASIYNSFRDRSTPPSVRELSAALSAAEGAVSSALRNLADEHCIVLTPGTEAVWMAHPFSGIETDFVVRSGGRRWFANCVWDGLSILALFRGSGDGSLDTHSPATGAPIRFEVSAGAVHGAGIVHFLVPARCFWDDIGYT
jgi:DNA-binding transcriptional MocR family regulator